VEYYDETFKQVQTIIGRTEKLLMTQVFSQKMMENLINDLLDLAKIENNSFNISSEYFDLGALIYEAF
jgi:signal transduction histidine kinase